MDEFSKTMIAAAIGGGLTILGGIITKGLDFWFATLQEKRDFIRSGREKAREEIEELKNQVGTIYELSSLGKDIARKPEILRHSLPRITRESAPCNKYSDIAMVARGTVFLQTCSV